MLKSILRYLRLYILHLLYRSRPRLSLTDKTIIIAPHPDDEVIGCAGLIYALVERGMPPHVIILTGGENSHVYCCSLDKNKIVESRHQLTLKAAATLGLPVSHIHCLHYPDGGVALEHPETERLRELLGDVMSMKGNTTSPLQGTPPIGGESEKTKWSVFVPHCGEVWSDHLQAAEITKHLLKGQDVSVYEYCVWMWYYNVWRLDSCNARLLRMSHAQHQRKLQAIDEYVTSQAPCGKPWSGVLPKPFLKAARWNKELYFLVR